MIQQTTKLIGTEITTTTVFKTSAKVKFAPILVNLKYKRPNGELITLVIEPIGDLLYVKSVLLDEKGIWKFRWESIGVDASADEFEVFVDGSILN